MSEYNQTNPFAGVLALAVVSFFVLMVIMIVYGVI